MLHWLPSGHTPLSPRRAEALQAAQAKAARSPSPPPMHRSYAEGLSSHRGSRLPAHAGELKPYPLKTATVRCACLNSLGAGRFHGC